MLKGRLRIARLALALLGVGAGAAGPAGPAYAAEESAYERAQRLLQAEDQFTRCRGQRALERLIDAGEVQHALELMERYRTGDGVPRIAVHAIYWASHAVRSGLADRIDFDALKPQYEALEERADFLSELGDPLLEVASILLQAGQFLFERVHLLLGVVDGLGFGGAGGGSSSPPGGGSSPGLGRKPSSGGWVGGSGAGSPGLGRKPSSGGWRIAAAEGFG
eukprot:g13587.t1